MTREELRQILESDTDTGAKIDSILDRHHEEVTPIKEKLEIAEKERSNFKEELDKANTAISELEKNSTNQEKVQSEINSYKQQIEELNAAREADKIDSAVELGIMKFKGINPKAVKALLDMDKIRLEKDGSVTGIEDQLKSLVESDPNQFQLDDVQETRQETRKAYSPKAEGRSKPEGINPEIDKMLADFEVGMSESKPLFSE